MAEADLTKLGLETLDHTGAGPTPADHDYTQYWRDYQSRLFDAGYKTAAVDDDFTAMTRQLEAVSDKWLNGRLPDMHHGQGLIRFTRCLTDYKANLGHYTTLGEYGTRDVSRLASLLIQASFGDARQQPEHLEADEVFYLLDEAPLRQPKTAFEAAESLQMVTMSGLEGRKRIRYERRAMQLYDAVAAHPDTAPLLRFVALGHKEDIELRQLNQEFRQVAGRAGKEGQAIARLQAAVGRQALRLAGTVLEPGLQSGHLFESFMPLLLRVQSVEDLQAGKYDPRIGTFGVRHAFTQEDFRPIQGLTPNPTFDAVIARVTQAKTVTTPVQAKRKYPDGRRYLPPVVFGNGVLPEEMRAMSAEIAAEFGATEGGAADSETLDKLHMLRAQVGAQLLAA